VLVYPLHGVFTGLAHHNIWLFLLNGPTLRLVISILLFTGLLSHHRRSEGDARRSNARG
jgi:two-component system, cell cycle response regulator